MTTLIEHVVVDMNRLIQKNLLSTSLHRSHNRFILRVEIIEVKLLGLDIEDGASNAITRVTFALEFEDIHTIVITCTEVV